MPTIGFLSKLLKKKSNTQESYLVLTITPDIVLALIWSFEGKEVRKLGFAQKPYRGTDDLTHQAAVAIDTAGEQAKSDVTKVVFGIPKFWFEKGQLSPENAKLLESVSQDLELEAQAFVSLSVSVKNLLKVQEKITPYAVLLGLFENSYEAHLTQNNQITTSAQLQEKPTTEGIKKLIKSLEAKESLPSRIVVFGTDHAPGIINDLVKDDLDNLFTQKPKIDFIDWGNLALSVALTQASDISGYEINLISPDQKEDIGKQSSSPDEFGFVQGQDILKEKESGTAVAEQTEHVNLKETGFKKPQPQPLDQPESQNVQISKVSGQQESLIEQIVTLAWFDKITSIFKKPGISKRIATFALLLILGLILTSVVLGQSITRSQVTVKVKAQSQESNFSAQVNKNSSSNFEDGQIGGDQIASSTSGNQKAVATGKKKSGTPAKGEVKVFNFDKQGKKKFPQGTEIITKDGLKFTLDNDVEIASRSATLPGENKVSATARDIGPKYNISQGIELSIVGFDDIFYSAVSETSFSGGDEKEITVASSEDLEKLEKSLLASLEDKAIADLKSSNPDKVFHDEAIVVKVQSRKFDKNIDEEASIINLGMEVEATTIAYDENSLKEQLATIANETAPDGLEARAQNIEILTVSAKSGRDVLNLSGKYKANYIPKFDQDQIKEKIAGKNQKQAREILKEISQVDDVDVDFSPAFLPFSRIPKNKERISLEIETI